MDEFQTRMEIVYTVAELPFQSRMEISYTIYAPVFLEGVSTTEYCSEAYIIVHGYAPSTTITDGEGFLFVDKLGLHGVSETVSDGEGFQRTGARFLVLAATETGGDGRFLASTPRPLSSVSDTYSDGEGSLYTQVFFQGSPITETDGDAILSFLVVSYRGYSAFETVGEGFLFVEVFVEGSSSTDTVADAYLLIGVPMRGTSFTETASDESPFDPVYPRGIPGTSLSIAEGDGLLFADLFLRGPSVAKAEGQGRLSTDAYLRSMGEDTKTDGDGFLFYKVPLWGVSDTDASGEGRFIAPRPIPMGGVSHTSTDGDGRFYIIVSLLGASFTWTYGQGFLRTRVYLGPGPKPIPPSITETTGFGPFIAPYPRPMDGSSLTVTDSEGHITEAKFLVGTSATETDGVGELSILRALMGMSVTLTDSGGRITEAKFLPGRSITETYNVEELSILNKPDLMKYLPAYYEKSKIMKAIQDAYSTEFGYVYLFLEDFLKQFLTPTTATRGLAFWEQELGLKTDISKRYEERREIIMARLRGIGTVGKDVIKRAAEAFSGGDVEVVEYPEEHRFVVRFIGTLEVPKNMASFIEMIEDLKPAHLTYNFMYTYTWWYKLKEITWAQAGMGTWNDLRVYG